LVYKSEIDDDDNLERQADI